MYEEPNMLDDNYAGGPGLPPEGSRNLRKAGKWGRFLGIVYMVFIGIGVLIMFLFGGTMMTIAGMGNPQGPNIAQFMLPMLLFYGVFFAIFLYLAYLLYNFGSKAMVAVDRGDETAITASFGSLGRLFKILGIVTIIQLAFTALSVVIFLFSGAAALLG